MVTRHFMIDCLVLSPHLDDAVLSCWGLLTQRVAEGKQVCVATVMTSLPEAHAAEAQVRIAEDIQAMNSLGCHYRHLDFTDAVYRTETSGQSSLTRPGGRLSDADRLLLQSIEEAFRALPSAKEIVIPMAIGWHIDHLLTKTAGERIFGSGVQYFEDFPYNTRSFAVSDCLLRGDFTVGDTIHLSKGRLHAKTKSIWQYASQARMLFGTPDATVQALLECGDRNGSERYWHSSRTEMLR